MKFWSSGNSFLRHLNDDRKFNDRLSMDTQSHQELLSALVATLTYVKRTNIGKAKIRIHHGTINICIASSKETSL